MNEIKVNKPRRFNPGQEVLNGNTKLRIAKGSNYYKEDEFGVLVCSRR